MSTIIRRTSRPARSARVVLAGLVLAVLALVAVLALAWQRGGPQPVRAIAIDLPEPDLPGDSAASAPGIAAK